MATASDIWHKEALSCKEPKKNIKKIKKKKEKKHNIRYLNIRCRLIWKIGRWSKVRWGYHGWKTFMDFNECYKDKVYESIQEIRKQNESRKEFESKVEQQKASIKEQKLLKIKAKSAQQERLSFNELKNNCVKDAIIKAMHAL
ncbi:unnamed protein product [Blepharisma stoltei]|uniref:Uncharacterized protein n=1 Tax=Blepharisma stoltei TaxID=1481888 RepID=A0AAU9JQ84_9CILI|nr:unnamed protein product [Blepharisma stoltei]